MTRPIRRAACALLVLLALSASATAQGMTWIVDRSGGPGTHFTDIPPAVAAASDGDTVVIRAGTYSAFETGKALTMLGEGSVTVTNAPLAEAVVEVTGLGPGKTFVAKNLAVSYGSFNTGGVHLWSNAGRIHLENLSSTLSCCPPYGVALRADDCALVTLVGRDLAGGLGLQATRSTVALTSVTAVGSDAQGRHTVCDPAHPGIELHDATAYLAHTDARGGNGVRYMALSIVYCPAQPAVRATGGALTVAGDARTTLAAGLVGPGFPVPAIAASTAGQVTVESTVTLVPTSGAPAIEGSATLRRVISLTAAGAPPGGSVAGEIVCSAGDPIALLAGAPAHPLPTPFGALFVDPARFVASGVATQGPGEHFPFRVRIPALPRLRGAPLALQALHFDVRRGELALSGPAVVVLD